MTRVDGWKCYKKSDNFSILCIKIATPAHKSNLYDEF